MAKMDVKKKDIAERLKLKHQLTTTEVFEIERMLFDGPTRNSDPDKLGLYRDDYHPQDILRYFEESMDSMEDPERVETDKGQVSYVQRPVRLPTLGGYAMEIGVTRETLWTWSKKHGNFGEAYHRAKALQEYLLIQMGVSGGFDRSVSIFILKNLQGWQDKVEQTIKGGVTIQFDDQDKEA